MTSGKGTEGPCAPLFLSAAITCLLLSASQASSQSVEVSVLELCAGLETPELKLACFEAIIASSQTRAAEEAKAVAADTSEQLVHQANGDFEQEHVVEPEKKAEENDNEIFRATVTDVTRDHNQLLFFHLDNGHVWRQLEARHFQYPKAGRFEINIARGMMGDYRMRIGDNGRMVRVRRVK